MFMTMFVKYLSSICCSCHRECWAFTPLDGYLNLPELITQGYECNEIVGLLDTVSHTYVVYLKLGMGYIWML